MGGLRSWSGLDGIHSGLSCGLGLRVDYVVDVFCTHSVCKGVVVVKEQCRPFVLIGTKWYSRTGTTGTSGSGKRRGRGTEACVRIGECTVTQLTFLTISRQTTSFL